MLRAKDPIQKTHILSEPRFAICHPKLHDRAHPLSTCLGGMPIHSRPLHSAVDLGQEGGHQGHVFFTDGNPLQNLWGHTCNQLARWLR